MAEKGKCSMEDGGLIRTGNDDKEIVAGASPRQPIAVGFKVIGNRQVGEGLMDLLNGSDNDLAEEQLLDARGDSGVCAVLKVESGNCLKQIALELLDGRLLKKARAEGSNLTGKREVGIRAFPVEPCLVGGLGGGGDAGDQQASECKNTERDSCSPRSQRRDLGHPAFTRCLGNPIEGCGVFTIPF
jgi:hypothetical protein